VTWDDFFTAEVGAAAALAGLIFVGISINLQRIVALPLVANRSFQALLILVATLALESLLLVPDQSATLLGVETLGVAVASAIVLNEIERRNWRRVEAKYVEVLRTHTIEIQLPYAFAAVGGIALLAGAPWALYWFVPATLVSFLVAILEAWVITVEILR